MPIIIKNNTKEDIFIEDLQITILFAMIRNLTELGYSIEELNSSNELKDLVYFNCLIINDGVYDLEIDDALNLISIPIVCEQKDLLALFKGGLEKQVLTKTSDTDFDFVWSTLAASEGVLEKI